MPRNSEAGKCAVVTIDNGRFGEVLEKSLSLREAVAFVRSFNGVMRGRRSVAMILPCPSSLRSLPACARFE